MKMGMRQYILALLVFGMVQVTVGTELTAWVNGVHKNVNFECPPGETIVYVYGMIISSEDDRMWRINCAPKVTIGTCSWSGFSSTGANSNHQCSGNGALAGIRSYYDTASRDRRFAYRCCSVSSSSTVCSITNYLNSLDRHLEYGVPAINYVNGMATAFDSGTKDRRWQMYECRYRY
ncbi:hypothetical protein SNE40_000563 [Patella caerulea]|uniref:Dermatopontin n=1 Tax=Patella caerulea TaxID=87958 RepID=A0AAN8KLJ7_PATCE